MRYLGGKHRSSKSLLGVMLPYRVSDMQAWVEPFLGGANVAHKVCGRKILGDSNKYVISMWREATHGWRPDPLSVTEERYNYLKFLWSEDIVHPLDYAEVGFVGLQTFGGKFFGGWARDNRGDDYIGAGIRNLNRQSLGLVNSSFYAVQYSEIYIPSSPSLIYCDPPYADTTGYGESFNSANFWAWCANRVEDGHLVFVSENKAPEGWTCLWEGSVGGGMRGGISSDKLWMHHTQVRGDQ